MVNENIYSCLKDGYKKSGWDQCCDDIDCVFDPSDDILELRTNFHIGKQEKIIFFRDWSSSKSRNYGCVITDVAIYVKIDEDAKCIFTFMWKDIKAVAYHTGKLCLNYLTQKNYCIGMDFFAKGEKYVTSISLGRKLAKLFSNVASLENIKDIAPETPQEIFNIITRDYRSWYGINKSDSILTNFPESEIYENFYLLPCEKILYFRDTSSWNNRNQGLVLTDWGVHLIKDNQHLENQVYVSWQDLKDVRYRDSNFVCRISNIEDIRIPCEYLIKRYDSYEQQEKKDAVNYLSRLLKNMINSAPYIAPMDVDVIAKKSEYIIANNNIHFPSDLIQKLCSQEVIENAESSEFATFVNEIAEFERMKQNIIERLNVQKSNFQRCHQNIIELRQNTLRNNIQNRGGHLIPRTKGEALVDGLVWLFGKAGEQYADYKEKSMINKMRNYEVGIRRLRDMWMNNQIEYLAALIDKMLNSVQKFSTIYEHTLTQMISKDDTINARIITAQYCFAIYCRMLYSIQRARAILVAMEEAYYSNDIPETPEFLSLKVIVKSELNKLLEDFSRANNITIQGLQDISVEDENNKMPLCIAMINQKSIKYGNNRKERKK